MNETMKTSHTPDEMPKCSSCGAAIWGEHAINCQRVASPQWTYEAFELQLEEDAERLLSNLAEGDGQHSEALDVGLIKAAFRNVLKWARADGGARDVMKSDGLYRKFDVHRTDGSSAAGGKHHGCNYFVLDVTHDRHADAALRAYADSCEAEYPALAADLRDLASQSPIAPPLGSDGGEIGAAMADLSRADGGAQPDLPGLDLEPYRNRVAKLQQEGTEHIASWMLHYGHIDGPDIECPACDDIFGEASALRELIAEIERLRASDGGSLPQQKKSPKS